jgi:hypothetical protein
MRTSPGKMGRAVALPFPALLNTAEGRDVL